MGDEIAAGRLVSPDRGRSAAGRACTGAAVSASGGSPAAESAARPLPQMESHQRLKILFVLPMPPRSEAPGAIPRVLRATLLGLHERHDVTVATAAGDEDGEMEAAEALSRLG